MEQFSLKEYLKNPERKVVTRDGRNVRIICTDCRTAEPLVALVNYGCDETLATYWENGRYSRKGENNLDLFFAPNKHTDWVNLYRTESGQYKCGSVHESKQDAKKVSEGDSQYVTTIKVEWEE